MCELCQQAAEEREREQAKEERQRQVLQGEPRINLELLQETWEQIEHGVLDEAARRNLTIGEVLKRTQLNGWDQENWRTWAYVEDPAGGERCETALCFAGWTVQLDVQSRKEAGVPDVGDWVISDQALVTGSWQEDGTRLPSWAADCLVAREDDREGDVINDDELPPDARLVRAETRAVRLLGLTQDEASELFNGSNSFGKVREVVMRLRSEELVRRARRRQQVLAKRLAAQKAAAEAAKTQQETPEV